jgi:hypothetical protein
MLPNIHTEPCGMSEANRDQTSPSTPILTDLMLAYLTPMFLAVTGGNIQDAHFAAAQTLESYRTQTDRDLIGAAQVLAFSLAALGSLTLAMSDDLSPSMILRLRGNAQGSNRAAEQNRRALQQSRPTTNPQAPEPPPAGDTARIMAEPAATRQPATEAQTEKSQPTLHQQNTPARPSQEQRDHALWAAAFSNAAADIVAGIPNLAPHQRQAATMRAAALNSSATDLLSGNTEPRPRPGDRPIG